MENVLHGLELRTVQDVEESIGRILSELNIQDEVIDLDIKQSDYNDILNINRYFVKVALVKKQKVGYCVYLKLDFLDVGRDNLVTIEYADEFLLNSMFRNFKEDFEVVI